MLLPENHERSLAITAKYIDNGIKEIESLLLNNNPSSSVLTIVKNLTQEKRIALLELLKELKSINEKMIKDFSLSPEIMYEDRIVRGKISLMWVILSDSTSKGLKGYGTLNPEQAQTLDEYINSLLTIVQQLQSV